MIGTDKVMASIAHVPICQHRTAMRTAVKQDVKRTFITTNKDHRLAADLEGSEIPLVLDLAFMASINPAFVENMLYFLIEDFIACVTGFVNPI